ncbi:MAG: CoA transferase [Phenylobacterium sp.]|nr:CoA transferase [Phenylobacterium sp.]
MSPIQPALDRLCADIEGLTEAMGRGVRPKDLGVLDRAGHLTLGEPGRPISPNGACRMLRAADGWVALNLAREDDRALVPAWVCADAPDVSSEAEAWALAERGAAGLPCVALIEQAALLGLPVSRVGERVGASPPRAMVTSGMSPPGRVVDLSALWAGPLCGAILAAMGAEVTKVESQRRPDPTRETTPRFFQALNGGKTALTLDLSRPADQGRLRGMIECADILITSARPRALPSLGLDPEALFAANPSLVWVAITGHGWSGEAGRRVAFGDDAAAAGGLIDWTGAGPVFLGDALADPVAGLEAARGALLAHQAGGGLVDVSMAGAAADAAWACGLRTAV